MKTTLSALLSIIALVAGTSASAQALNAPGGFYATSNHSAVSSVSSISRLSADRPTRSARSIGASGISNTALNTRSIFTGPSVTPTSPISITSATAGRVSIRDNGAISGSPTGRAIFSANLNGTPQVSSLTGPADVTTGFDRTENGISISGNARQVIGAGRTSSSLSANIRSSGASIRGVNLRSVAVGNVSVNRVTRTD